MTRGYRVLRVVVRAFNKEGYHRDILIASERQVHSIDTRVKEPSSSLHSGLLGWGGQINPEMFPEMTHFEVVIQSDEP